MVNEYSAAVVGMGRVGSRHVQSLLSDENCHAVTCVDIRRSALDDLMNLGSDVRQAFTRKGHYSDSLDSSESEPDIIILAVSSAERGPIFESLRRHFKPEFWILEKYLAENEQSLGHYYETVLPFDNVYVNLPMRTWEPWSEFYHAVAKVGPEDITIDGAGYGLATNLVHYLDIFSWCKSAVVTSIEYSDDPFWFESKRPGYDELYGSIRAELSDGSSIEMTDRRPNGPSGTELEIKSPSWCLSEALGRVSGRIEMTVGSKPHQSELTSLWTRRLLNGERLELPLIREIMPLERKIHRSLSKPPGAEHLQPRKIS